MNQGTTGDIIIVQDMNVRDFQSKINELFRRGYVMIHFGAVPVSKAIHYHSELTAVMQLKRQK